MSIGVILRAVDEVTAPLKTIGGSISNFQNKMSLSSAKLKNALAEGANAALVSGAADKVASGLVAPLKHVIDTGADYEVAMSKLSAATGKPIAQLKEFSDTAQELGMKQGFRPQQVVEGMTELAKAGLNAKQALTAIEPVLHLTAAGDIALGEAATIASDTMSQFNLKAEDMGKISDVLVAAADASTIGVRDLAETFKYAAPAMSTVNQSLEETAALTALLGKQGLKGSIAGTSIKAMVNRLSGGAGQDDLQSLGVNARMSQGNIDQLKLAGKDTSKMKVGDLRKIPDILADIADKTKKMGTAQKIDVLKKIFGDEGYGGAVKLMDMGSDAILEMTREMEKNGIAKKKAGEMTDNYRGAQSKLTASFDVLSTSLFTAIAPALTWLTTKLAEGVGWVARFLRDNQWLAKALMVVAGALGAFAAAIGPVLALGATMKAGMALWSYGVTGLTQGFGVLKSVVLGAGQSLFAIGKFIMANPFVLLIAAVVALIYYWKDITEWWDKSSTGMKVLIGVVGGLVAIIGTIVGITKAWTAVQTVINFLLTANPIGIIVMAIAALVGGIALLIEYWDVLIYKLKNFDQWIKDSKFMQILTSMSGGGVMSMQAQMSGGASQEYKDGLAKIEAERAAKGGGAVSQFFNGPQGQPLPTGAAVNQNITNKTTGELTINIGNAPPGTKIDSSKANMPVNLSTGVAGASF